MFPKEINYYYNKKKKFKKKRKLKKLSLAELENFKVDWVYFIFEKNEQMISYCKLITPCNVIIYVKYSQYNAWYTHNENVFIKKIRKHIDIENQLFSDLMKQNNCILATVKNNNECTRCITETLVIPNIFQCFL